MSTKKQPNLVIELLCSYLLFMFILIKLNSPVSLSTFIHNLKTCFSIKWPDCGRLKNMKDPQKWLLSYFTNLPVSARTNKRSDRVI